MSEEKKYPEFVKKPEYNSPRYIKIVNGKQEFNQKRFDADNKYYNKWLQQKNDTAKG